VFAAADVEHAEQLEKKGLLVPRSRAIYATGILALWIPPGSAAKLDRLEALVQPKVKVIAMAKPELAPYGQAARETLEHLGIWGQLQSRIVYADNINMAKQYGATGNADAVFTAYSLLLKEKGKVIQVNEKLHQPIRSGDWNRRSLETSGRSTTVSRVSAEGCGPRHSGQFRIPIACFEGGSVGGPRSSVRSSSTH